MQNVHQLAPAQARDALVVLDQLYAYYTPLPVRSDDKDVPYLPYRSAA